MVLDAEETVALYATYSNVTARPDRAAVLDEICQALSGAPDTPRQYWRKGWDYSAHPEPRPCGAAAARRSKSLQAILSNKRVRPHTLLR